MITIAKDIDWLIIKEEYVTSKISYKKLAEKYDVRYNTLTERAASEGWVQERVRYREEIEEKTFEELKRKTARKNARQRLKESKKVNEVSSKLLEKVLELVEFIKTPKELKTLTDALINIQKLKGIKSDEDIKEQEARTKVLLHSVEKDIDKGPATVKVIIEGNDEFAE